MYINLPYSSFVSLGGLAIMEFTQVTRLVKEDVKDWAEERRGGSRSCMSWRGWKILLLYCVIFVVALCV